MLPNLFKFYAILYLLKQHYTLNIAGKNQNTTEQAH